jgi:hypothetical protein
MRFCGKMTFKNARTMDFLEVRRAGQKFSGGSRKSRFLCGAVAPAQIHLPERLVGGMKVKA